MIRVNIGREEGPIKAYPWYIVNPEHQRVLAPGGGVGEPHRGRGSWDSRVGGRDKERVDVECAG